MASVGITSKVILELCHDSESMENEHGVFNLDPFFKRFLPSQNWKVNSGILKMEVRNCGENMGKSTDVDLVIFT